MQTCPKDWVLDEKKKKCSLDTVVPPLTVGFEKGKDQVVTTSDGEPACPVGTSSVKGQCRRTDQMPAQKVCVHMQI